MYQLFKFLHVIAAMVWFGGGVTVALLNFRLSRIKDLDGLKSLAAQSRILGRVMLGPSALTTLLAGIAATITGGLGFKHLWISWGFAAVILSIVLGASLIRVTTQKIEMAAKAGDGDTVWPLQYRLAVLNVLNLLILASTVWAMVYKPVL